MSASLINRSLTTVRTELEFLKESNVISEETYNQINSSLPQKYDPKDSKSAEFVEALYRFDPQQDGDLALNPGDKVEVLEKPSNEWFKGKCNGRVGMFPSNYVKPIFSGSEVSRPSVPPPPQYEQQQVQRMDSQPSGSSYQQPLPYPPPSTGYYQQQPAPQPVQQEQPQQHHAGSQLRKFGSKLGNAAIFGAGATMGSDIVNSIF
ncbi:hypothetical protein HG537_0D00990 [Torulaspora globosa]|uniref:SH3 domain-containing protein n=1 Tax=Torulaspora globosa TaxID=48254 RepID=A0A7H9HS14_9SACH|nr:hypothetical protein HG537_0D00990 [Torulaspora sp. CBS 2947]